MIPVLLATLTFVVPQWQSGAACSLSDRQVTDSMFVCLFVSRQSAAWRDSSAIAETWNPRSPLYAAFWKRVSKQAEPVMLERTFTSKRGTADTLRTPQDSGLRWYHLRMENGRGMARCWNYVSVEGP